MPFDHSRYTLLLLEAMGLRPLSAGVEPESWTLRALFQPTFHHDCCLTLLREGPRAVLEWIVLAQGARAGVLHQMGLRGFAPPRDAPRRPKVELHEVVEVGDRALSRCLQVVEAVDPYSLPAGGSLGIDGMPVHCEAQRGALVHRCDTWSPSAQRDPLHHRYLCALLDLAQASLSEPRSQQALAEVRGYLR